MSRLSEYVPMRHAKSEEEVEKEEKTSARMIITYASRHPMIPLFELGQLSVTLSRKQGLYLQLHHFVISVKCFSEKFKAELFL